MKKSSLPKTYIIPDIYAKKGPEVAQDLALVEEILDYMYEDTIQLREVPYAVKLKRLMDIFDILSTVKIRLLKKD